MLTNMGRRSTEVVRGGYGNIRHQGLGPAQAHLYGEAMATTMFLSTDLEDEYS